MRRQLARPFRWVADRLDPPPSMVVDVKPGVAMVNGVPIAIVAVRLPIYDQETAE